MLDSAPVLGSDVFSYIRPSTVAPKASTENTFADEALTEHALKNVSGLTVCFYEQQVRATVHSDVSAESVAMGVELRL